MNRLRHADVKSLRNICVERSVEQPGEARQSPPWLDHCRCRLRLHADHERARAIAETLEQSLSLATVRAIEGGGSEQGRVA